MRRLLLLTLVAALATLPLDPSATAAPDFGSSAFERAWARTDRPVALGEARRSWVWGPEPIGGVIVEPYVEGRLPGREGSRRVLYFDKGRMEITGVGPDGAPSSTVSSGLLASELITGRIQLGEERFLELAPAELPLVESAGGDALTYADLDHLTHYEPLPLGWTVTQTLDAAGAVGDRPDLARHGVTTAVYVEATGHTVASVFWEFMTSSGPIYDGWDSGRGLLFDDPFAATGLPITEPYWVALGDERAPVLLQAFQRRVLTYSPGNPEGWRVESANVGRHYYDWRYGGRAGERLSTASVYWSRTADGSWLLLGEARNETRAALDTVRVTVDLFGADGRYAGQGSAFLDLTPIQPGERLPFRVWFDPGIEFDRYEIHYDFQISPAFDRVAVMLDELATEQAGGGVYRVSGVARNHGAAAVEEAAYVVALYDEHGRVIDYMAGLHGLTRLEPGQAEAFEVTFAGPRQPVAGVRVFFGR